MMGLTKEYRICMPLTVEEYKIGQLYMIARHSFEQSDAGEGVEVIENKECFDPVHGKGQYTEKRIHLSSRLPTWVQSLIPKVFYITEKAWNYYPYTITEYSCSFLSRLNVHIETKYEDNSGTNENCLNLSEEMLENRIVVPIDIAYDQLDLKHYKEEEDPCFFKSQLTGRGPLTEGWIQTFKPIMCSYKLVTVSFEVWGLQTRVEEFIHSCVQNTLLVGHRQAFVWIDEWYSMTLEDVREYEKHMHAETNAKLMLPNELNDSESIKSISEEDDTRALNSEQKSPLNSNPTSPIVATVKSWLPWS